MKGKIFAQSCLAASLLWGSCACALAQAEDLPSFYDLRLAVPEDRMSGYDPERARINPIRDQGIFGTCWAFSAIASVESNLYTQMQAAGLPYNVQEGTVDLSEWYLAWVSMAPPIDVEEDYVYHTSPRDDSRFYRPYAQKVYDVGGLSPYYLETMLANGTGLDWEESKGVRNIVAPRVYKEPVLQLKNIYFAKDNPPDIPALKEMLMKYGALSFALNADPMIHESYETAFYNSRPAPANHAINIIGWDDDYDFAGAGLPKLPKHKGAWIVRNSWGENWGNQGYAYLSYEEKSFTMPSAFQMEADTGYFSHLDTYEANNELEDGEFGFYLTPKVPGGSAFAAGFTSEEDAFLRQVGFYALEEGMDYSVEVRLGSKDPAEGKLAYRQEGRFGEDGTPAWSGYRTIPLQEAVFLPKDTPYTVSIGLSAPQGDTHYMLANSVMPKEYEDLAHIFVRLGEGGPWQRVLHSGSKKLPAAFQQGSVVLRCYLKKTGEPVGDDFTLASLDDQREAAALIDLGRRGEAYGKDFLHQQRETLSAMLLDLREDSSFGGCLTGEGTIVKKGPGTLTLRGENTCTGTMTITEGLLCLSPAESGAEALYSGDVLLQGGTLSGSGRIGGSLGGKGRLMLTPGSCLTLEGSADLSGLELEAAGAAFKPGEVLLRAEGGIRGLSQGRLYLSEDGMELLFRG